MGTTVEFSAGPVSAPGYLAVPEAGSGPGVIVIQEWWGVVPQLKRVCDRLSADGFCALAPDLYHGDFAEHTELDKAGALLASLPLDQALEDMGGAVDFLLGHPATNSKTVGIVGFCMGGVLTFLLAASQGGKIGAAVPYYGAPLGTLGEAPPSWAGLLAPVLGHFAELDEHFPVEDVQRLAAELRALGKQVSLHVYPSTGHGFANEENPLGQRNELATADAWGRTLRFLHENLD